MEGFAVSRASELIVGEPVAVDQGQFIVYHVPVTLNLRDFGARACPIPRVVHYYFASDAEGMVAIEGPAGELADSVLNVVDVTGVLNVTNSVPGEYTGRLVVQTLDGVIVSAPLNIPPAVEV